ncbi:GNAT family N-acetyltransferase [Cohnella nanjingensis]|uniref:GNAT family N-acetyltransferase n=1 Tax=Cohnella nanjingensis TaxID=1387779 RepID=UPI0028AC8AB1|nr:GNAT family N-acetyltransferase [Cohnella nanjingensis]
MRSPLVPSLALAAEIERSKIGYMSDRMTAIRSREGNPEGVEIRAFGQAVAFYSRTMPWPAFNTVKGLRNGDADALEDILAFYNERGRRPQFEIVPGLADTGLLRRLSELGCELSGYHTSLYADPSTRSIPAGSALGEPAGITVRELREEEIELYATIHCRGTGLPDDGIRPVAANNRVLFGRPGWKIFLASVHESPAAVGVLHVKDGIASCTFAATLPEYRNRGLQQLLLKRRLEEAAAQGCRLAVSQCAYASQSHRNMERVGMKIGYIRSSWTARN